MNHEQGKFTPPNPDNRDGSLRHAYELERQAGAVAEAQRNGRLQTVRLTVFEVEEILEAGLKWYHATLFGEFYLYSGDCDEDVVRSLPSYNPLTLIQGIDEIPDVCFGRKGKVIAALLTKDKKVAYKSPEFDLETYMQEQSQKNQKADEHEK